MPDDHSVGSPRPPAVVQSALEALLAYLTELGEQLPPSLREDRDLVRSWLDAVAGRKATVELGTVVATPGALAAIHTLEIAMALVRHQRGDWGNLDAHDWRENDRSVREGFRLLSAYCDAQGTRFWVITEADRSVTTVLLPQEY